MSQTISPRTANTSWVNYIVLFFVVVLLVTLSVTLVTFVQPEMFRSTARIKLEWGRENAVPLSDPRLVKTEVEVVKSETVLRMVAETYDLNNAWAATFNGGMPLKTSESVHILGKMIGTGEEPGRNIISITGFGSDARSPAQMANAVTEAYMAHSATNSADLKIIVLEKASPALRPFRPNKPFNIICGIIGGGVLGLFVVGAMAVLSSMKPRPAA